MNRYRTVPGIGPSSSKATTTTTCQKCLKKGHYSYECKASVQSRPYISRPSRSQQLQNPKLKPALAELKMEEPKIIPSDQDRELAKPKQPVEEESHDPQNATGEEVPSRKRRRSASLSSNSSVATISTAASEPRESVEDVARLGDERERRHSRSSSPSSSSPRSRPGVRLDRSEFDHSHVSRPREGSGHHESRNDSAEYSRQRSRRSDVRQSYRDMPQASHRGHHHPYKSRRSHSPETLPDNGRQYGAASRSARPRSLSPYSRRLALTQAMNASN